MSDLVPDGSCPTHVQPQEVQLAQHASHDLDANAQWLEILAAPCALPSSQPAATAAGTLQKPPAAAPDTASAQLEPSMADAALPNVGNHKQSSIVDVSHGHDCPAKSKARASRRKVRRPESHHADSPIRSCLRKLEASSDHDSSSCGSSRPKTFTRRSHSVKRQVHGHHQSASSEDSDQMTFAEAAGIRRRPDDISWPAYEAIHDGRQVRLLDRHSPAPARSKAKTRQHRTSSRESRSARCVLHSDEDPPPASDPVDAARYVSHRACMRKVHGATKRASRCKGMQHASGSLASDDENSSSMLDRLLSAWQQGANGSCHQEPFIENAGSTPPDGPLHQSSVSHGRPDGVNKMPPPRHTILDPEMAVSMQPADCWEASFPDERLLNTESPDCAQEAGRLTDCVRQLSADCAGFDMSNGCKSAFGKHADDLLAGFWDTWQEAAKEPGSAGNQDCFSAGLAYRRPESSKQKLHAFIENGGSSPLDVAANQKPRRHRQRHADKRKEQRPSVAAGGSHWPQQQYQQRMREPSRSTLKQPAAAAAASRLVEGTDADPLEGLLQMYPGLDPVVADLVLQVQEFLLLAVGNVKNLFMSLGNGTIEMLVAPLCRAQRPFEAPADIVMADTKAWLIWCPQIINRRIVCMISTSHSLLRTLWHPASQWDPSGSVQSLSSIIFMLRVVHCASGCSRTLACRGPAAHAPSLISRQVYNSVLIGALKASWSLRHQAGIHLHDCVVKWISQFHA